MKKPTMIPCRCSICGKAISVAEKVSRPLCIDCLVAELDRKRVYEHAREHGLQIPKIGGVR